MQQVTYKSHFANLCRNMFGQLNRLEKETEGACILIYHALIRREIRNSELERYCTPIKIFRSHMKYLKKKSVIISINELLQTILDGEKIDSRWVVISMDDALVCQVTLAAEMLDEYDFPWSLAVPTDLIESGRAIWTNELSYLVVHWDLPEFPHPDGRNITAAEIQGKKRESWINNIKHYLIHWLNQNERNAYINQLLNLFGNDRFLDMFHSYGVFDLASWAQLKSLHNNGVELVVHGATHQPMNRIMLENELIHEVNAPKDSFIKHLGHTPKGYALPGGVMDDRTLKMIKESGYQYCMTSNSHRVHSDSDFFNLPRIDAEYPLNILRQHMLRVH